MDSNLSLDSANDAAPRAGISFEIVNDRDEMGKARKMTLVMPPGITSVSGWSLDEFCLNELRYVLSFVNDNLWLEENSGEFEAPLAINELLDRYSKSLEAEGPPRGCQANRARGLEVFRHVFAGCELNILNILARELNKVAADCARGAAPRDAYSLSLHLQRSMESVDMESLFFMAALPAELLPGDSAPAAPARAGEAARPTWGDLAQFAARRALDAVLSLGAQG